MDKLITTLSNITLENKWIKKVDLSNSVPFTDYNNKKYFIHVANIELDNECNSTGKKKRNTVIKFVPKINENEFEIKNEWIYIFLINKKIVKIGGTRTGLKGRVDSYLCGHYTKERGKSGSCSNTNAFIYNTFEYYLKNGNIIEMYGYKLPDVTHPVNILDKKINILVQTYHAYETIFLEDFKLTYNNYPQLNDNCDPNYK